MMEQDGIESYETELRQEGMEDLIEVSWTENPLLLIDKVNGKCGRRFIEV